MDIIVNSIVLNVITIVNIFIIIIIIIIMGRSNTKYKNHRLAVVVYLLKEKSVLAKLYCDNLPLKIET